MPEPNDNVQLTSSEKRKLALQALVQAVPYIGGSLCTLYFATKQQKRFKRLMAFYKELAEEVKGLKDKIAPIEEHNPESLLAIIEELHEYVEHEHREEKRRVLKNYFKSTFTNPVKEDNYDERQFFLATIGSISILECDILRELCKKAKPVAVGSIGRPNADKYAIAGAVSRLRSYGFIASYTSGYTYAVQKDDVFNQGIAATNVARRFCEFCLTP